MRPRATSSRTSSAREIFTLSDVFHFASNDAFAGIVNLCANRIVLSGGYPLFALLHIVRL